ncbi:hypothetical protein Bca52824_081444 [Brassica carinata]|uniref:Jacalin-type lectin domain-containing protein n=1 Tax=Brassica carinata TaxID=52824 RepID=A0A8X7PHV6_BRACI|nr:hypothetical protein Bca52824_081444 [Brassica carinata]
MPSTKSAMQGGQTTGVSYDDGGDYDGVRKVYVTTEGTATRHIKFDYDKAGNEQNLERCYTTIQLYCPYVIDFQNIKRENLFNDWTSDWYQVRAEELRKCYCWVPWTGGFMC